MSEAREWSVQYDATKRRIQTKRANGEIFNMQELKQIITSVDKLDNQLKTMSNASLQFEIVPSEIARRQVLIENLRKVVASSNNANSKIISQTGSGQIHDSSKSSGNGFTPLATSERGLQQRQIDIMKLQDDMLLEIGSGVDRLHQSAITIGDEAKMSTRLLDDLDGNVEMATAALQAESKHAERIKDKSKVCWMYLCIVFEIIIIIVLLFLAF